jgi:hypothetical protein
MQSLQSGSQKHILALGAVVVLVLLGVYVWTR